MSTGCKTAICVDRYKDSVIDTIECGYNARDIIVNSLNSGSILVRDSDITYCKYEKSIEVIVDRYLIRSIERLNKYLSDERPYKPDFNIEGIEYVQ